MAEYTNPKLGDLRKAAPAMYEALKKLLAISVGCWRHGHPVFDEVRQALAQAEGK